jgi:hypothetical protein
MSEQAKVQKSSTLWSRYSMLEASLVVKNNVDISTALLSEKAVTPVLYKNGLNVSVVL